MPPLRDRSGRSPGAMRNARGILYAALALAVPVLALLVLQSIVTGMLLLVVGTAALGWIGYTAFHSEPVQRDRLLVIVALMFFHMVFWACFEQAGSSINLFTARNVERTVFDWTIPAAMFQSVNPLYIILLAPLFSGLWLMLGRRRREPSTPDKFALGILLLAAGFGALAAGAAAVGADGRTSLLWLLLGYFFITTGELCLSPVGLAMVTRLAPGRIVGAIMGAWFLSVAFAHYLAALIAKLASVPRTDTGTLAAIETAPIYGDVFLKIALVAAGISFALFLIAPWLKARMHEKSDAGPRLAGAGSASGAQ